MRTIPASSYGPKHADFGDVAPIEQAILKAVGGKTSLGNALGVLLRGCIDDVIDTPSTGRCDYEELEKTEKTYLGTRVEIKLRALLGFSKGSKLDLKIAGREVDVKFTIASNWMIPTEAVDEVCLLIAADEENAKFYFGLLKAKLAYLSAGANKDSKRSVSAPGFTHLNWLLAGHAYPANFWRGIAEAKRKTIFAARGGTARLVTLFEELQQTPIHRSVIESVARQKDYMKRLRSNGGAKDELYRRGILLLGGKYDAFTISKMGLPYCDNDHFISTKIKP